MVHEKVSEEIGRKAGGHLKDHADMAAIWTAVLKPIIESHTMIFILWVPVLDLSQQRDLIPGSLSVMLSTLLHLHGATRLLR